MQVGIFSDVHGNVKALRAVWSALAARGLAEGTVLNAGDNVGYGDAPEDCVGFLREHGNIISVQGNYDRNVAKFPEKQGDFHKKWGKSRPEKFKAIRRDSDVLSDTARAWLLDLPLEQTLTIEGVGVFLTHYAPGVKEGIGPWTSDDRLKDLARETAARIVVCGHTHTPFVRHVGGVLWVNPGTVGRGWNRRAAYAILTIRADAPPEAQLHQVLIP